MLISSPWRINLDRLGTILVWFCFMKPVSILTVYRLPSGVETTSFATYTKEWKGMATKVGDALGCTVLDWDPDIYLTTKDGVSFQVPLKVAFKIVDLVEDAAAAWDDPSTRFG
jgi:hypothetical protein